MHKMKCSQIITSIFAGCALMGAAGCAMMPGNKDERTAGRWYDDHEITKHVEKALDHQPTYKFEDVDVHTFAGQVQLSGFVNTSEQKERAEQIAAAVPGVEGVHNSLVLKAFTPAPTGRTNGVDESRIYSRPPATSPTSQSQTNQSSETEQK